MLHEYRKKTTIKAEQFDGTDEMIKRYSIHVFNPNLAKNIFFLGINNLSIGDWIATGIDGENWVIADDIFRRTYERCDE